MNRLQQAARPLIDEPLYAAPPLAALEARVHRRERRRFTVVALGVVIVLAGGVTVVSKREQTSTMTMLAPPSPAPATHEAGAVPATQPGTTPQDPPDRPVPMVPSYDELGSPNGSVRAPTYEPWVSRDPELPTTPPAAPVVRVTVSPVRAAAEQKRTLHVENQGTTPYAMCGFGLSWWSGTRWDWVGVMGFTATGGTVLMSMPNDGNGYCPAVIETVAPGGTARIERVLGVANDEAPQVGRDVLPAGRYLMTRFLGTEPAVTGEFEITG